MNRRDFIKTAAGTGLGLYTGAALGVEPFKRKGPPRMLLSLAAYSLRESFVTNPKRKGTGKAIELTDFIDYCAEHGCVGTELTSYYFPPDVTEKYLLDLRRHAYLRGIEISGTAVGNDFAVPAGKELDAQIASVKKWIEQTRILGAPHIRIFAGAAKKISKQEAVKQCIAAIEECAEHAGKHGVFLGLENHGGIVAEADDLLAIVRAIKSPWVGINLDTGNFRTADPYGDIQKCAPYAVNVQVKSEIQPQSEKKKGPADLRRLIGILREANYQGYVALEYEAAEDPWQAIPPLLKELKGLLVA